MDDKTIRRKMQQIVTLAAELDAEAKIRYGEGGWLFAEAEGGLYLMAGDADHNTGSISDRQKYIRFHCPGPWRLGVGAW